jgi:hypothetical protein
MSVAVLFNLSDGLVLGVDSALTAFDSQGISKVFEDADKLFQLSNLPIGIASYGIAGLESRTIGSFIREFERTGVGHQRLAEISIAEVAEHLRRFFLELYVRNAETVFGVPFDQIPDDKKGSLGLIVGGLSPGQFLSEVWHVNIPWNNTENSAARVFGPGEFGCGWFASSTPIQRYIKGIDYGMSAEWHAATERILGRPLTDEEQGQFREIASRYEYRIPTDSMPIRVGIECARFLVSLVIGHYRFTERDPIVGGKAKIGVVTYRQESFQLLD